MEELLILSEDGKEVEGIKNKSISFVKIPDGIISIGGMAFNGCTKLIDVEIPNGVKSIGWLAFGDCKSLCSIDIPESVTEIDPYAFEGTKWYNDLSDGIVYINNVLYKLKGKTSDESIKVSSGTTHISSKAFQGCESLRSVILPNSVTSIGSEAFAGCTGLSSLIIPDSVTTIRSNAFSGCTSLAKISFPKNISFIGEFAFEDTKWYNNNPDGVVYIKNILYNLKGIAQNDTIHVKKGTAIISPCAFLNCSKLVNIVIPDDVKEIGYNAFEGCTSLKRIALPKSIKKIEWCTFANCDNLSDIIIPDGVEDIDFSAFKGCVNIKELTIPESYKYDKKHVNRTINGDLKNLEKPIFNSTVFLSMPVQSKGHFIIPEGIKVIARGAFRRCRELTSVTLPNSLSLIGDFAFDGCSSLKEINLSEKISEISACAFRGCDSLESINIPIGIKRIRNKAFVNCKNLKSVTIHDTTSVSGLEFKGCDSLSHSIVSNKKLIKVPTTFSGKYVVDDNITVISDGAFLNCKRITEIVLPEKIEIIGSNCFEGCESLQFVKANYHNDILATLDTYPVSLPISLKSIGDYAFRGCKSLTSVHIGNGVKIIPTGLFCECEKLVDVELPSSIEKIGASSFAYCINLKSFHIFGINLTEIGEYAFEDCRNMSEFRFLNGSCIREVAKSVFKNCNSLVSINLPYGVSSIENEAFSGCVSLQSVYVPSSVSYIKTDAFKGCISLKEFISETIWKDPIERLGLPASTSIIMPSKKKSIDVGDTEDGPMIHTHGQIWPCPYCNCDDITTYIDGTAHCNQCGKWFRYS